MPNYRLVKKSVSSGKTRSNDWKSAHIPDEAEHVEVEYIEPVGMDSPKVKANIFFLLPLDGDADD